MNFAAVIFKPIGMSSSDVVIKCRNAVSRALGRKIKCGHTGTLDPAAEGVLVLEFEKLTRLFDYVQQGKKTYVATFVFGKSTDTFDAEGKVTGENTDYPLIDDVNEALKTFIGETDQVPPAYSAVNVNGVRAYKLARKGEDVAIAPKKVKIYSISPLSVCENDFHKVTQLKLEIVCGSGTYIRSICRDLAEKLGVLAYMSALVRTGCAGFSSEEAVRLDDFLADPLAHIVNDEDVLKKFFPFFAADDECARKLKNGMTVACGSDDGKFAVTNNDVVIGIGAVKDGYIKLETHL